MRTGCRWRNTFESITSTRFRSVVGRPCRKIEVHAWVSVSQFQNRTSAPSLGATVLVSAISDLCLLSDDDQEPQRTLRKDIYDRRSTIYDFCDRRSIDRQVVNGQIINRNPNRQ